MIVKSIDDTYHEYQLSELEAKIGVIFYNRTNLVTALTRKSFTNENQVPWDNNERLEFLGDSVLQLIISEQLYRENKTSEGELTKLRQDKVKDVILARKLKGLHIEKYLLLGKGEKENLKSMGSDFYANIYEAIVGAIYLDMNCLEQVRTFVRARNGKHKSDILSNHSETDPDSINS